MKNLAEIQSAVKAKKTNFNKFHNYHYRSKESILESVKPIINPAGWSINVDDDLVMIGQRYYVKSTAILTNGKETYKATGWAREDESKKGMDGSQMTGSASSYAGKMALQNLFAFDDGAMDPDESNNEPTNPNYDAFIKQIRACKTEAELYDLYAKNKKIVEDNVEIRKVFTEQKLAL